MRKLNFGVTGSFLKLSHTADVTPCSLRAVLLSIHHPEVRSWHLTAPICPLHPCMLPALVTAVPLKTHLCPERGSRHAQSSPFPRAALLRHIIRNAPHCSVQVSLLLFFFIYLPHMPLSRVFSACLLPPECKLFALFTVESPAISTELACKKPLRTIS